MASGVGELLGRLDKVTSLPVFGRKIGELLEGVGVVSIEHAVLNISDSCG